MKWETAEGVMDLDFYLVVLFGWNFMSHNLKDWDFLHDPRSWELIMSSKDKSTLHMTPNMS